MIHRPTPHLRMITILHSSELGDVDISHEHAPQSEELGGSAAHPVDFTPREQVMSSNNANPIDMGNRLQQLDFSVDRKKRVDQHETNQHAQFLPKASPKILRSDVHNRGKDYDIPTMWKYVE